MLVSAIHHSESVMRVHISTFLKILLLYRPLQSIEQSSLWYTAGPYQLSISYVVVCLGQCPDLTLDLVN